MNLILKNLYFINNGGNKMKINLNDILVIIVILIFAILKDM